MSTLDASPPVLDRSGRPLDRIVVRGLEAVGHHGVYEEERRDGQLFRVDVALHLDTRAAAAEDDLAATVHYGVLSERIVAVLTGEPVDLLETLAERIAALCLAEPPVRAVDVVVHKPHAPIPVAFADVEVAVRRTRGDERGCA
ncbi:dihydroneopterin aldolase [Kineococcus xinjiangensis]|uniref:7,8-dihydroneopterin aldolase n=1 Tax=Kineococcus xinjiangensis TaxID=512762 RepID=A0A2S6IGU4_9ACTN|nr:dihydroneopterin aldolase [Kineococcus xinjiangensis]PPK93433.1 dihydroneopterin aldolase [Kineococcus xinjiangensis]